MHLTSLDEFSRRYRANNKTIILFGTVLKVEIGPKATALGMRRDFVAKKLTLVEETLRWTPST